MRGYLVALFEQLMPEPGMEAIAVELHEGNVASTLSSLQILNNQLAELRHEPSQDRQEADTNAEAAAFWQWLASAEGKETLQELADALSIAFERLQASEHPSRTAGLEMAWRTKLQVLRLLGKDPKQDDQLVQYLRKRVDGRLRAAEGKNAKPPAPLGPSEIAWLAELDGWDALPAEVLLDPLFARKMQSFPDDALGVMKRIAEAQPEQLAQETAQRLMRAAGLASKGERYFKNEAFFLKEREEEWKWVLRHLGEHASKVEGIDRSRLGELSNLDPPTDDWKLAILHAMNDLAKADSGSGDRKINSR